MEQITTATADYLLNAKEEIQQILFVPDAANPQWNDSQEIIALADRQILQPARTLPGEKILAFIGVHAKTALTGSRDSIGFLVTAFRVLTQTDFSVIGTAKPAQIDVFTRNTNADEISTRLWNDFTARNTLSIPEEQLNAMEEALRNVITIALPKLQQQNNLPEESAKTSDIRTRITELGLQGTLKSYAENEKKLRAFAEKYKVADLMYGIVDKPLFGGVYGLVISQNGIISRDLMEDSVTTTWAEMKENPASVGPKKDVIQSGDKQHVVPSHHADMVSNLIILLNEIANQQVSLS